MKSAGKARSNGLYRHIRTSKEIIRNLLNYSNNYSANTIPRGIFTMKAPGDSCGSAAGGFAFLCITKRITVRELNSYFYLR